MPDPLRPRSARRPSSDAPSRIPMTQRGQVRWLRRNDLALTPPGVAVYSVATGSTTVVAVCDRLVPLGSTVTIIRLDSFGMWRIA